MLKKIDFKNLFKEIVFDKKSFYKNILLIVYSTLMISLFPLVTQFYIRYAYKKDLNVLFIGTFIFLVLYVFKLISDIKVDKFKNKFFIKLEHNLQEKIIKNYENKQISPQKLFYYLDKKVKLYCLFVRKVLFENFESIIKIIFLGFVIFFLDSSLVFYVFLFIPFFIIYVTFILFYFKNNSSNKKKKFKFLPSFGSFFFENFSSSGVDSRFVSSYKKFQSQSLEKEIRTRNSFVNANDMLRSSVTFFRLIYFAYFGYLVIVNNISTKGLVVGLLFVTILVNSLIRLLQNIFFYMITKNSVKKIHRIINYGKN